MKALRIFLQETIFAVSVLKTLSNFKEPVKLPTAGFWYQTFLSLDLI